MDNLSGRQLLPNAELVLPSTLADGNDEPEEILMNPDNDSDTDQVFRRPGLENITWINGDFEERTRSFPEPDYSKYENMGYVEIFETFLDDEVIKLLVEESNKYALFCNQPNPNISKEEMKCTIAILIVTGYNELPGRDFYWDSKGDMNNSMVSNSMRRDRFRQILKYMHCADNLQPNFEDKMWKLRPLMDLLKSKFINNWIPEQELDYDESMIRYYGRHSCKQFIRGKPIRFGYKMWCLNSVSGYLINFDMYQGKNPKANTIYENHFGKCAAPLMCMIEELPSRMKKLPFKFYLDNLFTNFNLLFNLKQKGYDCTGTMRENRVPKSCTLPQKSQITKTNKRGDTISKIDKEDGIILVKWMDNNVVTVASTCYGTNPTVQVKRYSQAEKKIVQVPQPRLISEYNRCMGGTDLMDQHISRYRISIRRKKWWWAIFSWLLDVVVVNAWCISKKCKHLTPLTQLEFRREVSQNYLTAFGVAPKGTGKQATAKSSVTLNRVSDNLRYDRLDHLLTCIPNNKRRRCAGEGCSTSTRTMCTKCDVGLCLQCNLIFHKK